MTQEGNLIGFAVRKFRLKYLNFKCQQSERCFFVLFYSFHNSAHVKCEKFRWRQAKSVSGNQALGCDFVTSPLSALEQYCSVPLLKVECSVSDRFLKRSESSLNTFIGAEIAREPRTGKRSFQIRREHCKLYDG